VQRIKDKPPGRIDPIPEFKTYETFTYSASDLRDPFQMFEEEAEVVDVAAKQPKSGPEPDKNRNRETLEQYPLDTLRYVGQLMKDGENWAIVTSPDALVHRVKMGNYLGQNYGKIIAISEEMIDISELVPDGMGGWIERRAALSLGD
jgi:type IV pilus assembly protein PilP